MVKKIMVFALFGLMFGYVSAQRFEGGLIGGLNGSQVEGDEFKGYHKPGILAGFYVQTDLAPAVFAGMEMKYAQKGSRNKIKPKDPERRVYIMRLGYIDIPVFAGFRTSDKGAVVAGVTAGYLIHGNEWDENGKFPEADQYPFNTIDLQPFLGFQFDMLDQLKLDLRLAYSILPIRRHPGDDALEYTWYWRDNQFNNVISLAFYYRLGQ